MSAALCLSFSILAGTQALHVPLQVRELSQSRIKRQYAELAEKRTEVPELHFDDSACTYQGQYWYGAEDVTLSADHEYWRGRLQLSLSDLLNGNKIDFSPAGAAPPEANTPRLDRYEEAFYEQSPLEKKANRGPRLWPWLVGGALVAGTAYLGYSIYQHNHRHAPQTASEKRNQGPKRIGLQVGFLFF